MYILQSVYQYILCSVPVAPPEMGGVLGGANDIVSKCQIDFGRSASCGCSYAPNVDFLNDTIKMWQMDEIGFQGIFHTHFFGVQTLSDGDIEYIKLIMQTMPPVIKKLYFPVVVLPEKQMVPYLATRDGKTVKISSDVLHIV